VKPRQWALYSATAKRGTAETVLSHAMRLQGMHRRRMQITQGRRLPSLQKSLYGDLRRVGAESQRNPSRNR